MIGITQQQQPQLSYKNFIQMTTPLKENNYNHHQPQALKVQQQQYGQNINQVRNQTQVIPMPIAQQSNEIDTTLPMGKQYILSPGKHCQRCKCMLPEQILKMKQQIIKLQNMLIQEKDQFSRFKSSITQQSNKKIRQLQSYIDKLHDSTSLSTLVQQLQLLKDKQSNSILCLQQLSSQNTRLKRQCQKLVYKFNDFKQKSRFLNQSSRISSRDQWKHLDTQHSEFVGDYSTVKSSNSYVTKLEQSNTWLQKENKRLKDIISQGMKCR